MMSRGALMPNSARQPCWNAAGTLLSVLLLGCGTKSGGESTQSGHGATGSTGDTGITDTITGVTSGNGTSSTSVATDPATGTGETDCWQHFNQEDCEARGGDCEFLKNAVGYVFSDGACTPLEDFGWCMPLPVGGAQAPSVWYEPSTNRVYALSFAPSQGPPGWKQCAGPFEFCQPTMVEACDGCQELFCEGDGTGTGSSSTGSTGSSSTGP